MKKYISFLTLTLLLTTAMVGQQFERHSNFFYNPQLYNPAASGETHHHRVYLSHRDQWSDLAGSPSTQTLSGSWYLKGYNTGLGLVLVSDRSGNFHRNSLRFDYSYHIPIPLEKVETHLAISMSGSLMQNRFDLANATTFESGDPLLMQSQQRGFTGDANTGIMWYGKRFRLGVAGHNLIQPGLRLNDLSGTLALSRVVVYHGSFIQPINEQLSLEPAFVAVRANGISRQLEGVVRGIYQERFWLSMGHRWQEAWIFGAGVTLDEKWTFGYSYDLGNTAIGMASSGSHELFVSFDWGR